MTASWQRFAVGIPLLVPIHGPRVTILLQGRVLAGPRVLCRNGRAMGRNRRRRAATSAAECRGASSPGAEFLHWLWPGNRPSFPRGHT
jgi:hypothetical protein